MRRLLFEEMALVMLHLYELPDMEFLISNMDEPLCGCPVLSYAVDALNSTCSAFLMPSERLWLSTMSAEQAKSFSSCLKETYPDDSRQIKVCKAGRQAIKQLMHSRGWVSLWPAHQAGLTATLRLVLLSHLRLRLAGCVAWV